MLLNLIFGFIGGIIGGWIIKSINNKPPDGNERPSMKMSTPSNGEVTPPIKKG